MEIQGYPKKIIDFNEKKKESNIFTKKNNKREKHKKILDSKMLDYQLSLDKKYLKDEQKLIKIDKENEFKVKEVKSKCNINSLALKAGYTLGKVCLVLTFISCMLTFGGNLDKFICNIPLLSTEDKKDFIFTWTKILKTTEISNQVSRDTIQVLRFNLITTMIYLPFLVGMQSILYQISLTIYIIKTKFNQYYKYALILQYSMLFYSVYSNYMFITYYVRPTGVIDRVMCFIPSLLLDISCIFFLSLSMRMKTLNYDSGEIDKQDNLIINTLTAFYNFKNRKNSLNLDENMTKKNKDNSQEDNLKDNCKLDKDITINSNENNSLKKSNIPIDFKIESCLKNNKTENNENLERVNEGNKKEEIKKDKIEDNKTVINAKKNMSKMKTKKPNGNATNKVKNAELKRVKNYIKKLKEKGINKIVVNDLKAKCKIDKNRWLEIKQELIKENLVYIREKSKTTFINMNLEDSKEG